MSLELIVTGFLASLALFLCLVRKWQVDELEDLVSRVKKQRVASNKEADETPEDSEGLHLSLHQSFGTYGYHIRWTDPG